MITRMKRNQAAKACAKAFLILFVVLQTAECPAADRTIMLQSLVAYDVPENEVWKIADDDIADGPSTDLEFKESRVYVGTGGTLNSTFFLLSGDFDVSLTSTSDLFFFVQPGSKVRVGQRRPVKATIIMRQD